MIIPETFDWGAPAAQAADSTPVLGYIAVIVGTVVIIALAVSWWYEWTQRRQAETRESRLQIQLRRRDQQVADYRAELARPVAAAALTPDVVPTVASMSFDDIAATLADIGRITSPGDLR